MLDLSEIDARILKTAVCHILLLFAFALRDNKLDEIQISFGNFNNKKETGFEEDWMLLRYALATLILWGKTLKNTKAALNWFSFCLRSAGSEKFGI